MPLTSGTRVGPYEIIAPLGRGGMGEVYRARDTKLGRNVALKILPESFAGDSDRLMRFEREARTLASLNHPNIAAIYGIEGDGSPAGVGETSPRALVMELVEGEDLADRIARGAMSLDEVLPIARQIAEALEAAHEHGIIHRDLKPANIKVRDDGTVKVLDFGLAKAMDANAATSDPRQTTGDAKPTMTSPALTAMGLILGTAAYMSPEQARGRAVDARTDIWAFGCVLFEMLAGGRPFDGESVTDILGAIVHKEPEWKLLPASLPESLRHLLARCLAKDQKQRLHSIADVRLQIQDVLAGAPGDGSVAAAVVSPARMANRERVAWALAALSLAAAVTLSLWRPSPAGGESPPFRLSMYPAEGGEVGVPAISPDGRRVAYSARGADGMPMVWVRDLDQSIPRSLSGTEGGNRVFWSPDSRRLGFVVGDVLKQISADGGPVREVVRNVRAGASWGANDVIVYADSSGYISRVDASGGPAVAITTLEGPDWEHVLPSMLPDGHHFLYTAKHWAGLAEAGSQGIYLGSIDAPSETSQLLPELSSGVYAAPGYVVFARDGQLMAAPFDADSGRITGDPVALGEAVAMDDIYYFAGVSAAFDGTLAIRPPPAPVVSAAVWVGGAFDAELTLLERDGSVASRFGGMQLFTFRMALSPDGRAVVAQVQDARTSASELWRIDVASGARTPVTTMRTGGGWAGSPVWSPDGTRLAYGCQLPGILDDVCVRDMPSGVVTTVIQSQTVWEHPVAWSFDGQHMLVAYDDYGASSKEELRVWSADTNTLSPYASSSREGVFSPDARFVAFTSSETGREEVLVTTFPERQQTWPLTTDGGTVRSWSADGREILVATLAGHIVAYPVSTSGSAFSAGPPQVLIRNVGFDARFAVATRDHSRILVRVPEGADKDRGEIRLLSGWAKGLGS